MQPKITLLTLAVDGLRAVKAFYRDGLGLPTEGSSGRSLITGAVAFFKLAGGLILALYPAACWLRKPGSP